MGASARSYRQSLDVALRRRATWQYGADPEIRAARSLAVSRLLRNDRDSARAHLGDGGAGVVVLLGDRRGVASADLGGLGAVVVAVLFGRRLVANADLSDRRAGVVGAAVLLD